MPRSEGITTVATQQRAGAITKSEEMPRSEGITTGWAFLKERWKYRVRGNAPIRGDYDSDRPLPARPFWPRSEEMPRSEGITTLLPDRQGNQPN